MSDRAEEIAREVSRQWCLEGLVAPEWFPDALAAALRVHGEEQYVRGWNECRQACQNTGTIVDTLERRVSDD